MQLKKKSIYILVFLTIIFAVKGCGIFETRDPEVPLTIRSTYFPPTSADLVIDNLTYAIEEKNSENYSKCVSDLSFQYVPDSRSAQIYEVFASWDKSAEKRYLDNLIARTEPNSTSQLFLSNERLRQISSDSAIFQAEYIFVFQHNNAGTPKSGKGNLLISLATDSDDLFYMRKWEDFRQNDTDFTWSEFKANFSN
ncbi:MAG: hypothetical protein IAE90_03230 [Ignavibacteria bacterium]|nr:hypothetical protein [Ignavibacteria bacterium]